MKKTAAGFLIGLSLAPLAVSPASADDPPPAAEQPQRPPSPIDEYIAEVGPAFLDNQERLQDFKAWLNALPGLHENGYVESVNDAANRSTALLWVGASPLHDYISAEGKRRGITVTFRARKHTLPELIAAIDQMWSLGEHGGLPGFKIGMVGGVTADFDGITVHGTTTDAKAKAVTPPPTTIAGVPIKYLEGGGVIPLSGNLPEPTP
ncbi:hypothetical protein GCM10027589_05980 [Actinocorallia lasiicapitis]